MLTVAALFHSETVILSVCINARLTTNKSVDQDCLSFPVNPCHLTYLLLETSIVFENEIVLKRIHRIHFPSSKLKILVFWILSLH